jgi:prepilin signal peptidase PulO-like enzyme (type II secretory pathway)
MELRLVTILDPSCNGILLYFLTYISLMAKEFEHPFMLLLNIYAFPFEKCQLCSFILLLIGILALFMLSVFSSFYSVDINLLSDEYLTKILFHFPRCLLILVNVSFSVCKLLNLMKGHLSILALIS